MPKHLVTMLIGRIVEADTPEEANAKAILPFQHSILPDVVGISFSGTRLAKPEDEDGSIQARIDSFAIRPEGEAQAA
jgi:hypothetical protein